MYVGHRKTLHFPVYYSAFAALALFAALAVPSAATVGAALFLLGAAVHSVADMYGGGLELRPWEGNSDRAVYDHYRGTWIARDSSCGTTAQSRTSRCRSGCRFPSSTCSTACFSRSCSTLVVAAVYTMTRRHLAELAAWITPTLRTPLLPFLPDRYHDDDPKQ